MEKFLLVVHKIVNWLEGKKANIVGLSALTISFLVTKGWLNPTDATYIQAIITGFATGAWAVGKSGSYKDNKAIGKL